MQKKIIGGERPRDIDKFHEKTTTTLLSIRHRLMRFEPRSADFGVKNFADFFVKIWTSYRPIGAPISAEKSYRIFFQDLAYLRRARFRNENRIFFQLYRKSGQIPKDFFSYLRYLTENQRILFRPKKS